MRLPGKDLVFLLFIGFVLLPRISKQEKPEDCIPLKQYWSTVFINERGTCAPCPPLFETCSEQGADKTSCEHSCFAKLTIPLLEPAVTIPPTPTFYLSPVNSGVFSHAPTPGQLKDAQKSQLIILGVVLSIIILGLVGVLVLLCRKLKKLDKTGRDGENRIVRELLQQDNEDNRRRDQNDGERRAQLSNDVELERDYLTNDCHERAHLSNNVKGPVQESRRPPTTQPTAFCKLIKEIQQENTGSSLHVHVEIHN